MHPDETPFALMPVGGIYYARDWRGEQEAFQGVPVPGSCGKAREHEQCCL